MNPSFQGDGFLFIFCCFFLLPPASCDLTERQTDLTEHRRVVGDAPASASRRAAGTREATPSPVATSSTSRLRQRAPAGLAGRSGQRPGKNMTTTAEDKDRKQERNRGQRPGNKNDNVPDFFRPGQDDKNMRCGNDTNTIRQQDKNKEMERSKTGQEG